MHILNGVGSVSQNIQGWVWPNPPQIRPVASLELEHWGLFCWWGGVGLLLLWCLLSNKSITIFFSQGNKINGLK